MKCPKCGFEQTQTDTCGRCGIIIAKFLARQKKESEPPPPPAPDPGAAKDRDRVKTITIRRGHSLIRNVNAKDLPDRIRAGELYSSDEISGDGEKWILAGLHPQLKDVFQEEKDRIASVNFEGVSQPLPKPPPRTETAPATVKKQNQVVGGVGCILLALGLFLPVVTIPDIGRINFLGHSMGAALLVLVLASLSMYAIFKDYLSGLKYLSVSLLGVLMVVFYKFKTREIQLKKGLGDSLGSSEAYDGLGMVVLQNAEMSWGWWVLALGGCMVLTAGVSHEIQKRKSR